MADATLVNATPAADQVKLALERTFLAHERTLLAWNRTSTSLITFGFALYKFFYYMHQEKPPTHEEQVFGARTYGMCIMGIGVFTLVIATLQHQRQMRRFQVLFPEAPWSLSYVLAALMGTLGVIAFSAALFRL